MIRHELNLLQDYRNLDKLNSRLEFRVVDAISLFEDYQDDELQTAIKPLIETRPPLMTEALKRQDALIRDYWSALSYAQSNKDQSNEIIARWKKLENQSIFSRPYLEIGQHHQRLGNNQKACDYYEKCIELFSECEKAYFLKGELLLHTNKEEEGIDLLKIGGSISKVSSQAFEILGNHWERKGLHEEAIKMFKIVQKIKPSKKNEQRIEDQNMKLRKQEQQIKQEKLRRQQQMRQEQLRKEKQQKMQAQLREQEKLRIQKQQRRQELIRAQEIQEIQAQFRELDKKRRQEDLKRFEQVELNKRKSAEQTEKKKKQLEEEKAESLKKMPLIEKSGMFEKNKVIHTQSHQEKTKVEKSQQLPKKRIQMTTRERQLQKQLEQRIQASRNSPQSYFQMIELLKDKAMQKEVVLYVQELIKNCKRQKDLILPICKKILQLYHIFERKNRIIDIFKALQKIHKESIFGYLYQSLLSIIDEDRQAAENGIKACKIAIFVDECFSEQAGQKQLLQNYIFLFCSLISKENMDLSSLQTLFQIMLNHFEVYYDKKTIDSSSILGQLILMKNLVVQSTFLTPYTFFFLQGVDQQIILQYSTQILVKEEMAYIVRDSKELKRLLGQDCNIIAFPSTLTQLALAIENTRLRLKIMVPSIPEEQVKPPVVNAKCKGITGHNGRIRCSEGKSLAQIYEELIKESEGK